MRALEHSSFKVEVTNAQAVRAQSWLGSDSGLCYLEFGNHAVFIVLDNRLESVYTRGLKPELGPTGQISTRLAL